jgi:hypothetical protein
MELLGAQRHYLFLSLFAVAVEENVAAVLKKMIGAQLSQKTPSSHMVRRITFSIF